MFKMNDTIAVAILVLVIVIRFSPFIFMGKPLNTDSWKAYYPWHSQYEETELKTINYDSNMEYGTWFPMVKERLLKGEFPLWNEHSGCGMTMYDDHLIPVFHIPFAIALLFPGDLILAGYSFLMALIGTLFFYWFLRNWKFNIIACLSGGLFFFLSGWMMYLYPPEVATFIWIPAILLFHDRFLESNRWSDACWAAFFVGQLLIGGYPGMIAHFFYIVLVYVIWRRYNTEFFWNASVGRWVIALIIMGVLGGSLSMVQNYPTWKYSQLTSRDMSSESKMIPSAGDFLEEKKAELSIVESEQTLVEKLLEKIQVRLILTTPTFHPDFNLTRNFAGPFVVIFALIGLIWAGPKFRVMKILFIIFGVFYLAPPLFFMVAKIVPGWTISALPPREAFFFLLFFFGALGFHVMLDSEEGKQRIGLFMIIAGILIGASGFLIPVISKINDPGYYHYGPTSDSILTVIYIILSTFVLIALGSALLRSDHIKNSLRIGLLINFVLLGLVSHMFVYPYFASKQIMPADESVQQIKQIIGDERFTRYGTEEPRLSFTEWLTYIFPPNTASRFKLNDTLGYNNMRLETRERFMNSAAPGSMLRERGTFHILGDESLVPWSFFVQATGVRYVMEKMDEPVKYSYSNNIYEISGIRIYDIYKTEYDGSLQVRLFGDYELEENYTGDYLNDSFVNKVILRDDPVLPDGSSLDPNPEFISPGFKPIDFERKSMWLRVNFDAPTDCILYIADTYHPDWKARLDDEEVKIINANLSFRAVAVPEGTHTLYMWYEPSNLLMGGYISSISLVLLLIIGLSSVSFKRK